MMQNYCLEGEGRYNLKKKRILKVFLEGVKIEMLGKYNRITG